MGGAEVALLNILAGIREVEPEWKLHLVVADDGVVADKARALGVSTSVLHFPASLARLGDASIGGPPRTERKRLTLLRRLLFASAGGAIYTVRLRSLLRRLAPDVIHTNGFKMHILGALAKPAGVPLIWHIHDYVSTRPVMAHLVKVFRKRCSLVLANSNSVGLDVRSVCGDVLPVQTFYNGVDTVVFSPDGPTLDLDSLSGLPPSGPAVVRIGLLATLARWKGHKTFLKALSLIPPDISWRGYVIGAALYQTDGSQCSIEELKKLTQELNISKSVGFTGFVEESASAMRFLDIVVHASTEAEPFGMVIIESMACGRALVSSASGGAAEIVDADINALSHPPGDAAVLAQQITSLATSPDLRRRLGLEGRATVERRFSQPRLATELIAVYQRELRYA